MSKPAKNFPSNLNSIVTKKKKKKVINGQLNSYGANRGGTASSLSLGNTATFTGPL